MDSRLLVLDDDPHIGRVIQLVAEWAGMPVLLTTEPGQFFAGLESWRPTHIVIDLIMPQMDGVEVILQLAKRKCAARIIITSGQGGRILEAAGRSATEHGLIIAGLLPKPFSPSALRVLLFDHPVVPSSAKAAQSSGLKAMACFEVTLGELSRAIEHRDFRMVYQPKIECTSGWLTGFEALVRWAHPTQGWIMPDRFIAFAEAHDLIDALTDQVLDMSLAWLTGSYPASNLTLAINISARTVSSTAVLQGFLPASTPEPSFVDDVHRRCLHHGFDPSRLILELTESSAMQDPAASLVLMTRLRMKGINLSIDDFGTGYSSMLQMVRLPFSELKIDKCFVTTVLASAESRAVVKCIVDLGHSLDLQTTAEGVEDAQTLEFLRKIGCDLAQGYHIARPMPAESVAHWVEHEAPRFHREPHPNSISV